MRRGLLMLLAVALALTCALPAHAAKRKVPKGFYGVMWNRAGTAVDPRLYETQFSQMARSGVESVRTVFSWAAAQPRAGEPPSFTTTDSIVARAAAHRIDVLPVVIYTPPWARDYPDEFTSGPRLQSDYSAYLTALVGRYGPKGSFWAEHPELPRLPIRRWQLWNEPHFQDYWHTEGGELWFNGYTLLLRDGYRAVKRADPHATVVLAGLASYPWRYLKSIYKSGGKGYFDVMSINPFTVYPQNVLKAVRFTRRVLKRRGQARKPIWITEATWPASKGQAPGWNRAAWQVKWETYPKGMAKRLTELYKLVVRFRRTQRIGRVYWYTWATDYKGNDLFDYDGLLRWDGTAFEPQPALKAYTASARRDQGCRKTSAGLCKR